MNKTKLLSLILALLMLVSSALVLASCGKDEGEPSDSTADTTTSDTAPVSDTTEGDESNGGNGSNDGGGNGGSDAGPSTPVKGIGDNDMDITVDVSEW